MNAIASLPTEDRRCLAGKYLMVVLADESYGLPVLNVREIIRMQKITPVPQLPAHVKGVINLRGRVIPVLDLRQRFGLTVAFTDRSCIVVVQDQGASQTSRLIGLIVDAVEEVAAVSAGDIEPPPEFGTTIDVGSLLGLAKRDGQVRTLIDIERVCSGVAHVSTAA